MSCNTNDSIKYKSERLLQSSLTEDIQRFLQRRDERRKIRESRKPAESSTDSDEYFDLVAVWRPRKPQDRAKTLLSPIQLKEPSAKTATNTQVETNQKNRQSIASNPPKRKETKHEETQPENRLKLVKYGAPRSERGCVQTTDYKETHKETQENNRGRVRYQVPRKRGSSSHMPDHKKAQQLINCEETTMHCGSEALWLKDSHGNKLEYVKYQEARCKGGCVQASDHREAHRNRLELVRYQERGREGGSTWYDRTLRTAAREGSLHRVFLCSPCPPLLSADLRRGLSMSNLAMVNHTLRWGADEATRYAPNRRSTAAPPVTETVNNVMTFKIISSCVLVLAILAGGQIRIL